LQNAFTSSSISGTVTTTCYPVALSPPPATPVALSHSSGVLVTSSRHGSKPSLLSENNDGKLLVTPLNLSQMSNPLRRASLSCKSKSNGCNFDDDSDKLGREDIHSIEKRDSDQLKLKKRKLLLEELKLGVWT